MTYKKGALERYSRGPKFLPGKSVAKTASKALYVASKVAKALNVERKYSDHTISTSSIGGSSGYFNLLNGLNLGDGAEARDGEQVKFTKILVRWAITGDHSYVRGTGPQLMRFMIVLDKQADGATPALSELIENASTQNALSFNNIQYGRRFRVLKDMQVMLHEGQPAKTGSFVLNLVKSLKNDGIRTRYKGTTDAVADIASNAIWMVAFSPDYTTDPITFQYNCRLRYIDN